MFKHDLDDVITVSVLITYYNQKKYVGDSIASVLNQQTSFNFEILCGDDGSTDGTYEELLKWQDKYPDIVKIFRMDRDLNIKYEPIVRASNNRYNLLKNAKGKYFTILDGDDYYTSNNKLESQVKILERNSTLSACCHAMEMVWEKEDKRQRIGFDIDRNLRLKTKEYLECCWLPAEAFLFRNTFENLSNSINKDFFDDNLITMYFIKGGDILFDYRVMCAYRQTDSSSWNSRTDFGKYLVNTKAYQEIKIIYNNYLFSCFIRFQSIYRGLYDCRCDINNQTISTIFDLNENIYLETLDYQKYSFLKKAKYIVKWFFPSHCGKIVKLRVKLIQRRIYMRSSK